jgi:3-hydroxyacyl-CoA dehydrogenase
VQQKKKITIIGAGTTGHSLALAYARGNYQVTLVDNKNNVLVKAVRLIKDALSVLKSEQLISDIEARSIVKNISCTTNLKEALKDPDFLLEAVYEDPTVKWEVFQQADALCPEHTIFMSNTSRMNIFEIAQVKRQDRLLICHWFAPPHVIPLVEVVSSEATSPEILETVIESLLEIGKTPVHMKKYVPGFIINRIQNLIVKEMFWLVDNGYATIEDIDRAVKASLAVRMPVVGVMQSCDFGGLDTLASIHSNTSIVPLWEPGPPKTVLQKVQNGEFGVKTSKGLYDYSGQTESELMQRRDKNYLKILQYFATIDSLT